MKNSYAVCPFCESMDIVLEFEAWNYKLQIEELTKDNEWYCKDCQASFTRPYEAIIENYDNKEEDKQNVLP